MRGWPYLSNELSKSIPLLGFHRSPCWSFLNLSCNSEVNFLIIRSKSAVIFLDEVSNFYTLGGVWDAVSLLNGALKQFWIHQFVNPSLINLLNWLKMKPRTPQDAAIPRLFASQQMSLSGSAPIFLGDSTDQLLMAWNWNADWQFYSFFTQV